MGEAPRAGRSPRVEGAHNNNLEPFIWIATA